MKTTWFTSDQHFSHVNVIKYCNRPFENVNEMNEELVKRHNVLVQPGDTVYHLGDFSMNRNVVLQYLPRLNGNHYLIAGNHDACHPVWAKKEPRIGRMRQFYLDAGFKEVALVGAVTIGNTWFLLNHMPYHSDHTKDVRYTDFRPKNNGNWLLHGHVHQLWKTQDKMINVGVDVWSYAPVSAEEILDIVRKTK